MTRPAKVLIPLAFLFAAGYFLLRVKEVLFPFVLAAAFAYLLNPMVAFFEIRGLRRNVVVLVLYALLLGLGVFGAYHGIYALNREIGLARNEWPVYVQRGQKLLRELRQARSGGREWSSPILKQLQPLRRLPGTDETLEWLENNWQGWTGTAIQKVPALALQIMPVLQLTFLVPFLAYFFMVGGPTFLEKLLDLVPARYVEMVLDLMTQVDHALGNYLRALLVEGSFVGLLSLAGFWLIGLDYAVQVSLLIAVTTVIPYVGPLAGAAVGGTLALFQYQSLAGVAWVLAVCGVVQFLDNWILQPVIMKSAVELHPALILFALMAGGSLWGFWGLIFAVPAACMVKVVLEVGWEWYRSEFGIRLPGLPAQAQRVPLV